jgi:hypothetical protein
VYVFGALLEERAALGRIAGSGSAQQEDTRRTLLNQVLQPKEDGRAADFMATLFADAGVNAQELGEHMRRAAEAKVITPVKHATPKRYGRADPSELETVLDRIRADRYRLADVRSQAQRFLQNPTLLKELADALTIQLDHIDEWDWPETGVPAHAQWAHNKWRLFIDEDLPTACLLELLGSRWQQAIAQGLGRGREDRIRRLEQLLALGAPAIILQNERTMLAQYASSTLSYQLDIWGESAPSKSDATQNQEHPWGENGSILVQRAAAQGQLHDLDRIDSYGEEQQSSGMHGALALIRAEIELARAAFPDAPLHVLKLDLKEFYPSLSHDRKGLEPAASRWVSTQAVRRFLA